jgi:ankyrin repeat protein
VGGAVVDIAKSDTGSTPLYLACWKGHVKVAKLLILGGADVDKASTDIGMTPLLTACQEGHVDVVKLRSEEHTSELQSRKIT